MSERPKRKRDRKPKKKSHRKSKILPNSSELVDSYRADVMEAAQRGRFDKGDIRGVVHLYKSVQKWRVASNNQVKAAKKYKHSAHLTKWFRAQMEAVESGLEEMLALWSKHRKDEDPALLWSLSIKGIGHILAAGLSAHIDITRAPTAGHIWSFAGYNPAAEWGKRKKRPWNATLKQHCYLISDQFVRNSGRGSYYGFLYRTRKAQEEAKNEAGDFAEQAAKVLRDKRIKEEWVLEVLKSGRLIPDHIDKRARRYAAKIFLSHWHQVAYQAHYHAPPPAPFAIAHCGHAHLYVSPYDVPTWEKNETARLKALEQEEKEKEVA